LARTPSSCHVALISIPHPAPQYLFDSWVVDAAYSINLAAHHNDFLVFSFSKTKSTVGGVGVVIQGSDSVRIRIPRQSRRTISRDIFALYTLDLITRSSHGISRLLRVSFIHAILGVVAMQTVGRNTPGGY
jgi:hypothetical protein